MAREPRDERALNREVERRDDVGAARRARTAGDDLAELRDGIDRVGVRAQQPIERVFEPRGP